MMFSEDDLVPISAIQHLVFCERQCALIHIERLWADNRYTVEGSHMHDKVHELGSESRGEVRIARALPLQSLRLGLSGIADVVEFRGISEGGAAQKGDSRRVTLPGAKGRWVVFPVEYKRGKPKKDNCDTVQLCAQAMCLEEMLGTEVSEGALFYGKTRRRQGVIFDDVLREETEVAAGKLHRFLDAGVTPKATITDKCERCSLKDLCMPGTSRLGRSASEYLNSIFEK